MLQLYPSIDWQRGIIVITHWFMSWNFIQFLNSKYLPPKRHLSLILVRSLWCHFKKGLFVYSLPPGLTSEKVLIRPVATSSSEHFFYVIGGAKLGGDSIGRTVRRMNNNNVEVSWLMIIDIWLDVNFFSCNEKRV